METWESGIASFLKEAEENDKWLPYARATAVRLFHALEAAGCDVSVVGNITSHCYGTTLHLDALDPTLPAEDLNARLEAQRKIVTTITRLMGMPGRKEKESSWDASAALQVTWRRPTANEARYNSEEVRHAYAESVQVSQYMPPTSVRAPDLGTDWQGIAKALAEALRPLTCAIDEVANKIPDHYLVASDIRGGFSFHMRDLRNVTNALALYDTAEARPTGRERT